MRSRLAHVALCTWLLVGQQLIAQKQTLANESSFPCLSPISHEEPTSEPEVSISSVTFSGFIQMPVSDQDEVVSSIEREAHGHSVDSVVEEALERVRVGWQDRGYFKVQVSGEGKAKNETDAQIALFVHIEENIQYLLGRITFRNNRAITNSAALRDLFPIKDGGVFSREKIAEGLEKLRKAYGEYGYINFTPVPNTTFDDENGLAYVEVDVDEGKQFYVSRINVEGIGATPRQHVLKELAIKPGDIWNSRLWELSLRRVTSLFSDCVCPSDSPKQLDERTGTVALTLDFRPCSVR